MVDTTDEDYTFARRVCKDFEIKNLGEYHDFRVQNNIIVKDEYGLCCFVTKIIK